MSDSRTPPEPRQIALRPPVEAGGITELVEALATLVAARCVDPPPPVVLPSAPPAPAKKKAA